MGCCCCLQTADMPTQPHSNFRRPHFQPLDGPFLPPAKLERIETTREKEIAATLRSLCDSGVAPGEGWVGWGGPGGNMEGQGRKQGNGALEGRG